MKLFKTTRDTLDLLPDDATVVVGFHTEEITGGDYTNYVRDNKIGAVYGDARMGEVAEMLTPSIYAMTDEEVEVLEKLKSGDTTPADDVLVSDYFSDGANKAPFNLQVRNTTGDTVEFAAVVSGTPYLEIPDLVDGDYSLDVGKDDEGYVHTFSGKLGAYQSITITGGVPSPAGTGSGLELFIKEGS